MLNRPKQWIVDRLGITSVADTADRAAQALDDAGKQVDDLTGRIRRLEHDDERLAARLRRTELRVRVAEHTAWSATAPLRHQPTIGVVLATRNRAHLLASAIESVHAQTHRGWHLVVVDDGSTDDTPDLLADIDADDRLTIERTAGVGAAAARNVGLSRVRGDWVTFLDDDNALHPGWLRAVAEYTGRVERCRALFGAQLREDPLGDEPLPRLWFEPGVTLDELRHANTIDLGALAVRREHPELRFDESLERYIDWEMIVRIAASTGIDPLPVLSSLYTMRAAGGRISDRQDVDLDAMRRRLAADDG